MPSKVSAAAGYGGAGTAFVAAATLDVKAAAVAVVAPTYFGLTLTEWQVLGIICGVVTTVIGIAANLWFGYRRDQREERARSPA
jgi:hypothetical protein